MSKNYKMKWWGWGDENVTFKMKNYPGIIKYIREKFKIQSLKKRPLFDLEKIEMTKKFLPETIIGEFKDKIGAEKCFSNKQERVLHSFGKSYKDAVRIRSYKIKNAPDIILYPENEDDIKSIYELCSKHSIAIVPFGGGTSVVSGVEACKGSKNYCASVDLTRMDKITSIDSVSLTAKIQAGKFGPEIEKELGERGFTLGHFPQSFEFSTLGGWIAARSSGQNSILYGGIEALVSSLTIVSPGGKIKTLDVPRMACGPDFNEICLGSEGALGIITEAVVKITPAPARQLYTMYMFKDFKNSATAAQMLAQEKIPVAMLRVSDEEETEAFLAMGSGKKNPITFIIGKLIKKYIHSRGIDTKKCSTIMVGFEGENHEIKYLKKRVDKIFKSFSPVCLGNGPGKKWLKDRFFLPYLRDEFMDNGLMVDTLETSTTWSNLENLYSKTKNKIREVYSDRPCVVYTHISHLYHEGASLYTTIITTQDESDPVGQWQKMKDAVNNTICESGGAISHHHGIGIDHKNGLHWNDEQMKLMKSIKNELDPEGLMNPGKLI